MHGTGCSSGSHRSRVWLSNEDLENCKKMAIEEYRASSPVFPIDENKPILIAVEEWRTPEIVVYLPVTSVVKNTSSYFYYKYQGSEFFSGKAMLSEYELRDKQVFKLIQEGIVSWGTGPVF